MTINVIILNKTNLLKILEEPKKHYGIYKCTDQVEIPISGLLQQKMTK